jgi:adenosine deaminase
MDEQKLAREADQARRVQLLAAKLDKGYEEYARRFLEAHGQVFTETELVDFVQDLEEAFEEYREHPHIEERGHPAGVRMLIFCSMRNCLAEMLEELEGMPARTLFGGVKTRQIVLELRKKYRVQLRESLSVLPQ